MKVPVNDYAKMQQKFQQENFGYQTQIDFLTDAINKNTQLITALEADAVWEEVADQQPIADPGLAPVTDTPGMIV